MKQHSKLSSNQQQQHVTEQHSQQQAARDFASAEELLRFDAAQVTVPPTIERRLAESSAGLSAPKRSWWKRLFN